MKEIERLKKKDLEEAVQIYIKGINEQKPPGETNLGIIKGMLTMGNCYVHKNEKGKIDGLIAFYNVAEDTTEIEILYSDKKRKGVGKKLIAKLAEEAYKDSITDIQTVVSSQDEGAMSFYENMGFEKYGEIEEDDVLLYEIKAKTDIIKEHVKVK